MATAKSLIRTAGGAGSGAAGAGCRRGAAAGARARAEPTEDAPETGPLRRCIVTRESGPKEAMLRFVLGPDRDVVPGSGRKAAGAGNVVVAQGPMC